jgi:hypothetical protein
VYVRNVDSSSLGFSLSSYRQLYIGLVCSSHFIDLIINKINFVQQLKSRVGLALVKDEVDETPGSIT